MQHPTAPRQGSLLAGLAFILMAAGMALFGAAFLNHYAQTQRDQVRNELASIAEFKVAQITHWRNDLLAAAQVMAQNPMIAERIRSFLIDGRPDQSQDLSEWMRSTRDALGFHSVALLDLPGRVRLADGPAAPISESTRRLMQNAIRQKRVILSDVYRHPESDALRMDLLVPVLDLRGKEDPSSIGAVLIEIDPQTKLVPLIGSWPSARRTAEILLVRVEDDAVVILNQPRDPTGSAAAQPASHSEESLDGKVVQGCQGVVEVRDKRDHPVMAAVLSVPDTTWRLVVKVDTEEIWPTWWPYRWQAALSAVIVLLAVALLLLLGWRRQRKAVLQQQARIEQEHDVLARHYDFYVRTARDAIVLSDASGQIVEGNERAVQFYGYSRDEWPNVKVADFVAPDERERSNEHMRAVSEHNPVTFETHHRRRDGALIPVEVTCRAIDVGGERYLQSIVHDLSERLEADQRMARLVHWSRLRRQLSGVLEHAGERVALFSSVCQTLVEAGGFRFAWIGCQQDGSAGLQTLAQAGAETASSNNPGALMERLDLPRRAVGEGRQAVCQNCAAEVEASNGRDEVLGYGWLSMVAFPLLGAGPEAFVLVLCASSLNAFPEDDVNELTELAAGLSRSLAALQREEERQRAVEELRQREAAYRLAFRRSPVSMLITTLEEGRVVDVNDAFLKVLRSSREEVVGRTSAELQLLQDEKQRDFLLQRIREVGSVQDFKVFLRTREGRVRRGSISMELIETPEKSYLLTAATRLTDRS